MKRTEMGKAGTARGKVEHLAEAESHLAQRSRHLLFINKSSCSAVSMQQCLISATEKRLQDGLQASRSPVDVSGSWRWSEERSSTRC